MFLFLCKDNILGRLASDGYQLLRPGVDQADADLRRHLRQRERRVGRHSGGQGQGTFSRHVHSPRSLHSAVALGGTDEWLRRVPLQNSGTARSTGL